MKANWTMRFLAVATAMTTVCAWGERISVGQVADLALKDVVNEAQTALTTAPIPKGAPVAVLPLGGPGELPAAARVMLKSALTAAGKNCVEGKDDQVLDEIVKEIAWDERKEDILDPKTVDRFGRLQSAKYLLYGWIRRTATQDRSVLVELELHATEIATKRHVWGKIFSRRHFVPTADPNGRIDVPAEVRDMMRVKFRDALAASLKKSAKLSGAKNVVCLPIVADIDQYVYGLVRDVLANSSVTPVNLDVETRAEARFALRESSGKGDAILYGALRDVSADLKSVDFWQCRTYDGRMEIQLWIEKGATREILWSDTLAASEIFIVGPHNWWERLCAWFPSLVAHPWLIVVAPLGILLALIVLIFFVKNTTRVR